MEKNQYISPTDVLTVSKLELTQFAVKHFKEKGYSKKGDVLYKANDIFVKCFYVQGSNYGGYYVRPYVSIPLIIERANRDYNTNNTAIEPYGCFLSPDLPLQYVERDIQRNKQIPQKPEDIIRLAETFFEKWTNRAYIREMFTLYKEKGQAAYYEAGGTPIRYLPWMLDYILSLEFIRGSV